MYGNLNLTCMPIYILQTETYTLWRLYNHYVLILLLIYNMHKMSLHILSLLETNVPPKEGGGGFGTKCVLTFNSACKRNGEEFFTIWFNEQLKKNRLHVPDYFFEYQLNLLDNVVLSVLLYACKNADILKPVHTIFLRYILDLKKYVSQPGGRYIWRN